MRQLAIFLVIFSALQLSSVQAQSDTSPNIRCTQPYDEGINTDGSFQIYLYYEHTAQPEPKCLPFKFYGTGGNDNRFESEKYCMRNCSEKAMDIYPTDEREVCHLKKKAGECFSQYLRYYYDPVHDKCKTFFWTGCIGNGNRFLDAQACNNTCHGIHDEGTDPEEEEYDTPVALILGVVFGLIGGVILVAIIVLAVKSGKKKEKKTQQENVPMSDPNA